MSEAPLIYEDQVGNTVRLFNTPRRAISTVPSQTELLCDLGLGDRLIGRTKFCIHPEELVRRIPKIGGTKTLDLDKILELEPDIIIANKEENSKDQIEVLMNNYPVWVSDVKTIPDAGYLIETMGEIFQRHDKALSVMRQIHQGIQALKSVNHRLGNAIYLIWQRPWMTVGGDTFIHSVMETVGFRNLFGDKTRYPVISDEELSQCKPDHILLSSEPFPFKDQHKSALEKICPETQVSLVDGAAFSWYGSRLSKSMTYLSGLAQKLSKD